ncbi:MAG: MFS transporter, partial [Actinobacteria bacterium]|nr:MFS transporter [Actinomycetota bacterium]
YMVVAASLMILMGKFSDRIGARRAMLAGTLLFAVGSLVTGLATSLGVLLAGRAIQGFVLALCIPASLSLLNHLFPSGRTRVLAFSVWTAALGSAFALGPVIGGYIATYLSWRWSFFINIPLMLIAAAGIVTCVPHVAGRLQEKGGDILGSILMVFALAFFVLGIQEGTGWGWLTPSGQSVFGITWTLGLSAAFLAIVLGVVLLVVLVIYEIRRYRSNRPMVLEPALLDVPSFTWGTAAAALMTAGIFGLLLMVPLYAQYVLDYDPLSSGLTLLSMGVGMALGGPIVSRLSIAMDRRTIVIALIVQPLATLSIIPLLSATGNGWILAPSLLVEGFAWGAAYSILVSTLMKDVPEKLSGTAGGTQTAVRLLAGAIGTAVMTSVLLLTISAKVSDVDENGLTAAEQQQFEQLYSLSGQAHSEVADPNGETVQQFRQIQEFDAAISAVSEDMVGGFQITIALAALISATAVPCALRLPKTRKS